MSIYINHQKYNLIIFLRDFIILFYNGFIYLINKYILLYINYPKYFYI